MTVAELRDSLSHYPPNALVVVDCENHSYRTARDCPAVAVRSKGGHLSEDDERDGDGGLRKRGERRVAVVVFR